VKGVFMVNQKDLYEYKYCNYTFEEMLDVIVELSEKCVDLEDENKALENKVDFLDDKVDSLLRYVD